MKKSSFMYSHNMVWIGTDNENGKLDCDEPTNCLTKCYSRPVNKQRCESAAEVYLQCG